MKDYFHATFAATGSWIGNIYDLTLVTYIYAELEKSYHISLGVVSLLFALGLIGRFFGGLYLGNLSDKIGARRVMAFSTAGYAIFAGVMAFSPDVIILFSARFIQGIFMGGEWTSGTMLGYEFSPASIRQTIFGIIQSGYGIGYALTGIAYILFLPTIAVTWRFFLITGSIPLIIAPYTIMKIPHDNKKIRQAEKKINLRDYKIPLAKSMIMMSGFFSAYFAILSFYPTIATSFGVPASQIGIIMIISSLTVAAGFILFGKLAAIFRKKYLIMAGSMIALAFAWLAVPYFSPIRFLAVPGMVVFSLGIGSMPIIPLLLMDRINPAVRGLISGVSYNFGALFGGLISVLLGTIGGIVGYSQLLLIIDATTLVCLLAVFITGATIKKRNESTSYLSGLSGDMDQ
ncbi:MULTISPECIES: MFS transporter [Ferroplasma]|jgi:SHS family lactate transporter-like MFS transporter|uniref:Transporter n=4 Tax=Ferroplasma TaxID=74968 RepID=S0ARY0_FERAC|nr:MULTISPECIES: MFS transporter [Ferroplasma]AGO61562.1 transporter [Ferroplasma acidarmanus Fer1]ARD84473.1 major facilitator superfamily permease [Ferroplasma acidiphilum]MCL4348808.1 MFS transporter [Candidatus Thermoplasmatota archaeon]